MADNNETIGSNDLVVLVEMGDDFEPGTRTAAALAELAEALEAEHGDDVGGFASPKIQPVRSFVFATPVTTSWTVEQAWPSKLKSADFDGKGNDQWKS